MQIFEESFVKMFITEKKVQHINEYFREFLGFVQALSESEF